MRRYIPFLIIFIIFILFASIPFHWNEAIKNTTLDLLFKIRGSRSLSDKIVVVYIGDDDVNALGGWPISRDYYSYAVHVLKQAGARVIGLDLYFSKADKSFPEFDSILAEFMRGAGNVCLPMYFSELREDSRHPSGILFGENPHWPLEKFSQAATGFGFSNLGRETKVREIPLVVSYDDTSCASFGCELVRLYWGGNQPLKTSDCAIIITDSLGIEHKYTLYKNLKIRLNHFGSIENTQKIRFVSLITNYAENPLQVDFTGKIVVIMMAASGIAPLVNSPLSNIFPASLAHITAAENILENCYIREFPLLIEYILIVVMSMAAFLCLQLKKNSHVIIAALSSVLMLILISIIVFGIYHLFIPTFYPSLVFITTLVYGTISHFTSLQKEENMMRTLLDQQLRLKETDLQETKKSLSELQNEIKQESHTTEKIKQLSEKQKLEILRLQNEINDLKAYMVPSGQKATPVFEEIIYSPGGKMQHILDMLQQIAADDITVLITGETGTGKELIARAIHNLSQRKDKPFVAVNCGALSETLLESELFGHEKGSFTGALNQRKGRFEMAQGGTIFLDEISETSSAFQIKLLRVLQESIFERVGGQYNIKLDIRIIAATNKNLQQAMESNQFRTDLFYRLNGFPIKLPALRERSEDIPLLAAHFLKKHKSEDVSHFSDRAITKLQGYHWPGNVRELENAVHRAVILAQSAGRIIIQEDDIRLEEDSLEGLSNLNALHQPLEDQILSILRTLKFGHASISKTAKVLGNRDRGTITEYFRGICFQEYVESDFDKQRAAQKIADTTDKNVIRRVEAKLNEYLDNLSRIIVNTNSNETSQPYQGLPKKFHPYLNRLIVYLKK